MRDEQAGLLWERAFGCVVGFLVGGACGFILELVRMAVHPARTVDGEVVLTVAVLGGAVGLVIGAAVLNAVAGLGSFLFGVLCGFAGDAPLINSESDWPRWLVVLFVIGAVVGVVLWFA